MPRLGGLELSEEAAEALRERTEGWAAAVVLATLSLRDRDDAATRAAGLTGAQPQIADYLLEEVLERQPDNLKTFLLGTSILDRLTPPCAMRCSARTTRPIRSRRSRARMRSSSRSTIAASGTATTTCSVTSFERSSTVAIRSCSRCT